MDGAGWGWMGLDGGEGRKSALKMSCYGSFVPETYLRRQENILEAIDSYLSKNVLLCVRWMERDKIGDKTTPTFRSTLARGVLGSWRFPQKLLFS